MSNDLTVNTGGALISSALADQLASIKGDGFENVTQEDIGLAVINILQSNSPQCDKKDEQYLENVSEGQFFNTSTQEAFDTLHGIPIGFQKSYVEFVPRSAGGGFVGRHALGSPIIADSEKVGSKLITPNGNELVETHEYYFLVVPEEGQPYPVLIPFKSTMLKHSRRWLGMMKKQFVKAPDGSTMTVPMYFQTYVLGTGVESNKLGSWYGPTNISYQGLVPDELIQLAKEGYEAFGEHSAKAAAAYEKAAGAPQQEVVDAVAETME